MAVKLQTVYSYIGSSSDTKPVGVPTGSLFYEYDTGFMWMTYDGTNWERNQLWL